MITLFESKKILVMNITVENTVWFIIDYNNHYISLIWTGPRYVRPITKPFQRTRVVPLDNFSNAR